MEIAAKESRRLSRFKKGMPSSSSTNNIGGRIVVLASHLTSMALEKEAVLAAIPSDSPTIFDKIINKEIPSTMVYEDDQAKERHCEILGRLLYTAKLVAKKEGLDDGFRIVINDGPKGCQSVYHIHVYLLGGRQITWPVG